MDHHVGDREIAEAEDVVNVLGLGAFHLAVFGGFVDEAFDLHICEDLVLRGFLDAEQAKHGARRGVEQPVQRIEGEIGRVERIGDPL